MKILDILKEEFIKAVPPESGSKALPNFTSVAIESLQKADSLEQLRKIISPRLFDEVLNKIHVQHFIIED